jgi:hypothetical protein
VEFVFALLLIPSHTPERNAVCCGNSLYPLHCYALLFMTTLKEYCLLWATSISHSLLPIHSIHCIAIRCYSLPISHLCSTALLVRKDVAAPTSIQYTLPTLERDGGAPAHHPEGRVICAEWEAFVLLGTYTPNFGANPATWSRREQVSARWTCSLFFCAPICINASYPQRALCHRLRHTRMHR